MHINESAENYLETILIIRNRNGYARSIDIANELSYTKASVSVAMKQLRENGYVIVDENGNTTLTEKGIMHYKLTGSTPSEERFRLVDEFNKNTEIKVFLISLKAGGTGLNLVGADTVIHYDPWWNFSAESQASDRVHRIGQKHNVQIIKLITKDSIEEKILDLQAKKKELFNKVVSEDTNILNKLTNEELLSLFNIEQK